MKICVLHEEMDEFIEEYSGFSVYIEFKEKKILFDTSNDKKGKDILKNAKKLNIDLFNKLDYIVLSHGHYDHTNGLVALRGTKAKVLAHPDCFERKYYQERFIGSPFSKEEMEKEFKLILSKEPYFITEDIVFLGQVPRITSFEGKVPIGRRENGEGDFVLDDSALSIKTKKGLVIISGCSHSGICNIIEYSKEVCKENNIYVLLGGFHLFDKEVTDKTVEFIKKQTLEKIYPAHCLNNYAFSKILKIGGKRIHTLQTLHFEEGV